MRMETETNPPSRSEKLNKPIFLSTGGGSLDDVKRAVDNISKINDKLIIMHCTASYPASIKDMNLSVISVFKKEFKKRWKIINYSSILSVFV